MTKDIKDYLHLYLGCWCVVNTPIVGGEGERELYQLPLSPHILGQLEYYQPKPILRPLSDMTEEEAKEIWDSSMLNIGYRYNHRERLLCSTHTIENIALVIPKLLSRHFDLFGLIEAGLAIDKTTLKERV